ncbi:MAG: BON domain-containing protein [Ottowia sp.]|nr:BON domain-containing protein [Ottowia sp.]
MTDSLNRISLIAAAAALALGLAACNKTDDRTVGQQVDAAVAKTEAAADEAKAKAEVAAQDAKNAAQSAGADIRAGASDLAASASAAAADVKEAVADTAITASVKAGLAKDPDLSALQINVDTTNGAVSLQGTAPTTAAKERAAAIVREVKGVKSVTNLLKVQG